MNETNGQRNIDLSAAYGDYPNIWTASQTAMINLGHGSLRMAGLLKSARTFAEYYAYACSSKMACNGDFPMPEEAYEGDVVRLHDDIVRVWNEEISLFTQLWSEWLEKKSEPERANVLIHLLGASYRMLLVCSMRGEQLTRLKDEMYYSNEEQEKLTEKFIAALMQESAQSYVRASLQRIYQKEVTEKLMEEYAEASNKQEQR